MTEKCGAPTRKGRACRNPAGQGTDHPGRGPCRLHGGGLCQPDASAGGEGARGPELDGSPVSPPWAGRSPEASPGRADPPEETGDDDWDSVLCGALSPAERRLWNRARVEGMEVVDEEIRATTIREWRMLCRIADLKEAEFLTVEKENKSGETAGQSYSREKARIALDQIQDIEEALTRLQTHKARLIKLKHDITAKADPADPKSTARAIREYLDNAESCYEPSPDPALDPA